MDSRWFAAGALAFMLSGCAGVSPADIRARDIQACDGYGFERGTNAYAECLQRRDIARDQERRDRLGTNVYVGGLYGGYVF